MAMKDLVQDTYLKLREACIAFAMSQTGALSGNAFDLELWRVAQDEEIYQKELNELVRSISHLEAKVEETRCQCYNISFYVVIKCTSVQIVSYEENIYNTVGPMHCIISVKAIYNGTSHNDRPFGRYERQSVWETTCMNDSYTVRPFGRYERQLVWETAGVRDGLY